jgi:hypothetical protein
MKDQILAVLRVEALHSAIADFIIANTRAEDLFTAIASKNKADRKKQLEDMIPKMQSELTELTREA